VLLAAFFLFAFEPQLAFASPLLQEQSEPNVVGADLTMPETVAPNDPDFSDATMSYGLRQIDALTAWEIVTGSQEIIIAVIDSGINADHPEFAGRLVAGYDFVNNDTVPEDTSGHGTHVAGVIAAALDNGEGMAGVCPNCRIMPIKVLNDDNLSSWSRVVEGIHFAIDHGARIINISVGSIIPSESLAVAVQLAIENDIVVIASAGNYGSEVRYYPAALEGVIAIGATTRKGELWSRSGHGSNVDLVAPGESIYSTYHNMQNAYHGYTYMSGTSMAAPFVSGVAGLLLSVAPKIHAEDVAEALILGAVDLGKPGKDDRFANGRVNAMGALMAPVDGLVEAVGEIALPTQDTRLFMPVLSKN
jgi:subtilisin family serine protease